jgi:N-methylhydantoinase A
MAPRGGIQIITIAVELLGNTPKPIFIGQVDGGKNPEKALRGEREVYLDGGFKRCKIYTMSNLLPGNVVPGPSIIEGIDTTVVIPGDRKVEVDKYRNMFMRFR